jgi:glycosyltransferase involved in cell wall biosynthesis
MRVLFIHRAFPGQFRYIAPLLARRHGWNCTFLTTDREVQAPAGVRKINYRPVDDVLVDNPAARGTTNSLGHALGVYEALRTHGDVTPDLIVSHGGHGSTLFLPHLYDCPIINFFEYFYRATGQDLGYRPEQPVTEDLLLRYRADNAMTLLDLENCDAAWCPTEHQKSLMPAAYRAKVEVVHDGIDADTFRRVGGVERRLPDGSLVGSGTRIVTYVARGLEMLRGFDVFMRTSKRIYEQFPDVVFVVAGSDRIIYGSESQRGGELSFRARVLKEGDYDLARFRFVGKLPQPQLARLLSISDLHVYLTVPFFTSWSVLEAMSSGCVVLASDQACVRDYLTDGVNGLLCDFFDVDGLARRAVEVLKDQRAFRHLGAAARRTIEETFSIDATLPKIRAMFERIAAKGPRVPTERAEFLIRPGAIQRKRQGDKAEDKGTRGQHADPPLVPLSPCPLVSFPSAQTPPTPATPRTILFTWEQGGGLGHMMKMLPLAEDLARLGHRVYVALRELVCAAAVFGKAGVRFLQAPFWVCGARRYPRPVTYAQLLGNVGFGGDRELFARAAAWRNLFKMVKPDLAVFDHAPTALLASRGLPVRRALIGSGFCCPPDDVGEGDGWRWGVLRPAVAATADPAALGDAYREILARVNRQLGQWGQTPVERLGRLYSDVDENFLTTLPELDHFPRRSGAAYWGPVLCDGEGDEPQWPAGEGPRVFAYLKPFPALPGLLRALADAGCRTVVYGAGLGGAVRQCGSERVQLAARRLDVAKVARECDLAVLNGGHGVTAQVLLAGVPTLQIPLAQEQQMLADAVARLGAGDVADRKCSEGIEAKLGAMLTGDGYRLVARALADRYADFKPRRQRGAMLARACELLEEPRSAEATRAFVGSTFVGPAATPA